MVHSVLERLDPSHIVLDPQPYLYSTEALDPDYYGELAAAYPSLETVAGSGPLENNRAYLRQAREVIDNPVIPAIWRDFFAYHTSEDFFREMIAFWRAALDRVYPNLDTLLGTPVDQATIGLRSRGKEKALENKSADVMMDCQFGVNSPVKEKTAVRGPHVDDTHKLYAGLLYFRLPEDSVEGGDLVLYRAKEGSRYFQDGRRDIPERYVEPFRVVPYRANTLVMYLNTPRSIHGVSPRAVTPLYRRYINLQCECYRLTEGEFFPVQRDALGRIGSAVRRTLGLRDA